jgi:hypothetical protein
MTPGHLAPAQSANVVWDDRDRKRKGWAVHLHAGAEVIKYHPPRPGPDRQAADAELVSLAVKSALDNGYELNPAAVKISR